MLKLLLELQRESNGEPERVRREYSPALPERVLSGRCVGKFTISYAVDFERRVLSKEDLESFIMNGDPMGESIRMNEGISKEVVKQIAELVHGVSENYKPYTQYGVSVRAKRAPK